MKSLSRNKFLVCFRPVIDDVEARESSGGNDKDDDSSGCSAEPIPCPRKRALSRAVRTVLYRMILSKGVRHKKSFSLSKRSNSLSSEVSSSPSSSSYASNESKTEDLESEETKPNSVSTNHHKPSTRKPSTGTKQNQNAAAKQSLINSGLFLFLISLAITVLWGKLCAILFTLVWLYILPLSRSVSGYRRREKPPAARLKRPRSAECKYKKRVVMEGMLAAE